MKKSQKPRSEVGDFYEDQFNVSFFPHKSGVYRIEIGSAIEGVDQFSVAIQALQVAKEEDSIEIHLQCCGGDVNATGAFIHAMRKCEAKIHIVATGGCHSAATHILLEADSFELSENFNSLIHCGSTGAYGNLNEYHAQTEFDREFLNSWYKRVYEGFLTEEEIDNMLLGRDIWLDSKGWISRWDERNDYFKLKLEESNKPLKKPRKQKK